MNTTWASYGQDPANYKLAFARVQQIFTQNGVPDSAVKWVFAPNGWAHLVFEPYYPGDSLVDVIGASAYNWGYCNDTSDLRYWNPPSTTFSFYIKTQPDGADKIFITQAEPRRRHPMVSPIQTKETNGCWSYNTWLYNMAFRLLPTTTIPSCNVIEYYEYGNFLMMAMGVWQTRLLAIFRSSETNRSNAALTGTVSLLS
jgi:hypothetical protein